MNSEQAANLIETYSAQLSDEHYDVSAGQTRYYGGIQHNDDSLHVKSNPGTLTVTDGNDYQTIDPEDYTEAELREWVAEYMARGWQE